MIRNYFITAYRNLLRNKVYTTLNISGLALGMGCALVIYKIVDFEMGFDRFRENYENLYRIVGQTQTASGVEFESGTPFPLADAVRNDFADVRKVASVFSWEGTQITLGDGNKFNEELGVAFVEPQFPEMFGFKVLHGKGNQFLAEPAEAHISESLAEKYFGYDGTNAEDIIGKQVKLDNALKLNISAIFQDQPGQTDFPFTLLISYRSQGTINPFFEEGKNWEMTMSNHHTYVLMGSNADAKSLELRFDPFLRKYRSEEAAKRTNLELMPLSDEHFSTRYENFTGRAARKDLLLALVMIGFFLVATGSVNFVNMATAQSVIRAREMGIRKVLGGQRAQLVLQIILETFLITLCAVVISLGLAELFFINLHDLLGYRLHLDILGSWEMTIFILSMLWIVTLLSGLYPSLVLSRIAPLSALRSRFLVGKKGEGMNVRRALVILQFSISQFLIFATLVISSQMEYFRNTPLGFEESNILTFGLPENDPQTLELLRTQLLNHSGIESVSFCLGAPISSNNATTGFRYAKSGSDERHMTNFKPVDEHYIELYSLELLAGRGLEQKDDSAVVINETMVNKMGLDNPRDAIGERVEAWGRRSIIGVVRDFHTYSLHQEKIPTVLFRMPPYFYQGSVKLSGTANWKAINETVEFIDERWSQAFPDFIFEHQFLDEFIDQQYAEEQKVASLYQIFSFLAIFIGCLGLYGLVAFVANQKTKEIGIRKVLGASIGSIIHIFSRELLILTIIAFAIATPVAYYAMSNWLENFYYRIEIGLEEVITAFLLTLIIGVVTMGYRSIRAAWANPVISLRDE